MTDATLSYAIFAAPVALLAMGVAWLVYLGTVYIMHATRRRGR